MSRQQKLTGFYFFMKLALIQLNYIIGDFEGNTAKIIQRLKEAEEAGAMLAVFSELCICGYPPLDFLEFDDFIEKSLASVQQIAGKCKNISCIVGAPARNTKLEGKNLFNAAYFLSEGKIKNITHKTLLPTYDVFDEYRYFEPNTKFECINFENEKIAITICEDLWNLEDDPLYTIYPMDELIKQKPSLMINIAASPFHVQHAEERKAILKKNVERYQLPLVYVNQTGAQTEIIFDGGSLVFDQKGRVVHEGKYFEEQITLIDTEKINGSKEVVQHQNISALQKSERIYDALILGIRDYFQKQNFKKAILGLSGGVDSALVTVLAAHALGAENVKVIMMPSQFSSDHSISDSEQLVRNTGVLSEVIPIKEIFDKALLMLQPSFKDLPFSVAEENMQARIRALLLMAESNKHGYILLNTSNKSEAAVGYGTLYGDMCGGISVIGDVYKTEVYALCKYINRHEEIIPENILTKPPSAELRPGQKDSDSLPEYDILDPILYKYIEQRMSPRQIIDAGNDEALVIRILKLVNTNEYKRYQTPPMLRISSKAFGLGRRMPIVGRYLS